MSVADLSADKPAGYAERWPLAAQIGLTFRESGEADIALLEHVYASTRAEELTRIDWPDAQKAAFVAMQFRAQHAHYRQHYPEAEWLVMQRGADAVGRLYLEFWPSQHRIIDITFLPEHRGKGLGGALLADILKEAGCAGRDVSIHVEKFNPAMRLYHRLGFVTEEDKGVYNLMRWKRPLT